MMRRAETMRCGACSNFIPARSRRAPKRGFCRLAGHNTCVSESTRVCRTDFDPVQPIVPTNRDRLDAMSDAQLAQWLERLTGNPAENLLRWLRAPVETNEEETPWKTI